VAQRYIIDPSVQHGYVGNRTAATFLPFLLPHLRPGLDVLDAGCGVGSIALDVASTVAPGRVTGVDVDAEQVEVALRRATERAVPNVVFSTGSVKNLPFPDASFDAVYANAVLQHVHEPVVALREMRRVLRPGGVAAVSDDVVRTFVISPDRPGLRLPAELFGRALALEGGDAEYSPHLRALMIEAGFATTKGVAHAPEVYGDLDSTRWFAEFVIGLFSAPSLRERVVQEGWATPAELDTMYQSMREWGERPDAFAAWMYCGALGWT
jgi:ubiquinone/menaquinone biosynthesis C-methylase UbiE